MSEEHALARETEAAKLLLHQLKELGLDGDAELAADTIDGETNIERAIAAVNRAQRGKRRHVGSASLNALRFATERRASSRHGTAGKGNQRRDCS